MTTARAHRAADGETKGSVTRARLAEIALRLFRRRGFEATTLRDIAAEAGVSLGLLYRYFPSKEALVLALYDRLSGEFEERARAIPEGPWPAAFLAALGVSLDVLGPHRETLRVLVAAFVMGRGDDVFAPTSSFSRERVQRLFAEIAAREGADAPALGPLLYLLHLGVVLFWLLDRSERQTATARLRAAIARALPLLEAAVHAPASRAAIAEATDILSAAVFGAAPGDTAPRKRRSRP